MVNKEKLFEDWLIYGVDKHDWGLFIFREKEMPDPIKFAIDIMEHKYTYDEDDNEWYDHAGDPLSDCIQWKQDKLGWVIDCRYDGTIEGMTIECTPLPKVGNYLWDN